MVIYIRHGTDKVTNAHLEHDPRLSSSGIRDVERVCQELVERYGRPRRIYCSSFRRTRETAEVMARLLGVEIYISKGLRRYVRDWPKYLRLCHSETRHYSKEYHGETKGEFIHRVRAHAQKSHTDCWYITHALFLKVLTRMAKISTEEDLVPSCGWVHLEEGISSY
jgi:broad specificity phosphatase PhoE